MLQELEGLQPFGAVTEEALAALRTHYAMRLRLLAVGDAEGDQPVPEGMPGAPGDPAGAAPGAPAVGISAAGGPAATATAAAGQGEPVMAVRPAGPPLREFLADRSILIVSYSGAFLLIVATLLFETYAAGALSGPAQFGGVLALDLLFLGAAWVCLRSERLRVVGTIYLAIFALIAPLVIVAAYVFLLLGEQGVPVEVAQTLGAGACAVLYGALALRLRSVGYAALCLVAVVVGWSGALDVLAAGSWYGAGLAPLVPIFSLVAFGLDRRRPPGPDWWLRPATGAAEVIGPFRAVGVPFVHAAAAVSLWWTYQGATMGAVSSITAWSAAAVTCAGLAAGYAAFGWLSRSWGPAPVVALLVTGAALAANVALGGDYMRAVVVLVALSWAYALLAHWLRWLRRDARRLLLALVAVQAVGCLAVSGGPDWLNAALLLAVAALGVFLAWDTASPAWLLLAGTAVSVAWFWMVKAVVPPPPRPTFGGLVTAYLPLPLVLAGAAAVAARRLAPRWRPFLYAPAAANTFWLVLALPFTGDESLTGWGYLVYAAAVYGVAALERLPGGISAAGVLLALGVLALVDVAGVPREYVPLAMASISWPWYLAGALWEARGRRPAGAQGVRGVRWSPAAEHRIAALVAAGMVALACFGEQSFLREGSTGALTSLAALASCALLLFLEGWRRRAPWMRGAAALALSLGGIWIARYFGATNPQWYVALPGLTLVAVGLLAARGAAPGRDLSASRLSVGAGLALLLLTTTSQSVAGAESDALYTIVLVGEGVVALLGGIAARHRTLVLGGAAAIGVAALRALLVLLQQIPLFVVFGGVALALLVLGGLAAALRDRVGEARAAAGRFTGWSDWS